MSAYDRAIQYQVFTGSHAEFYWYEACFLADLARLASLRIDETDDYKERLRLQKNARRLEKRAIQQEEIAIQLETGKLS